MDKLTKTICQLCRTEFEIRSYLDGVCPKCGTPHEWEEHYAAQLTEAQKMAALSVAPKVINEE